MTDTPETKVFKTRIRGIDGDKYWVPALFAERLERERDEARDKLADWEDSAKHVRSEWPDEQHCSCVPILRKLLKDAERERDEAKEKYDILATEHMLAINKLCNERDEAIQRRMETILQCELLEKEREFNYEKKELHQLTNNTNKMYKLPTRVKKIDGEEQYQGDIINDQTDGPEHLKFWTGYKYERLSDIVRNEIEIQNTTNNFKQEIDNIKKLYKEKCDEVSDLKSRYSNLQMHSIHLTNLLCEHGILEYGN